MMRMVLVLALTAPALARTPNVVLFYADDLGIGDVGCYAPPADRDIRTPAIDALAASGVRFTNYYCAAPICSPSRAALLTGRHPLRCGMSTSKNIGSQPGDAGLASGEITIAELVRPRGYATALLGKWHLGYRQGEVPNDQGFDLFVGFHASLVDYFSHMYYWSEPYHHDLFRNRREIYEDGVHMTDLITREAIDFIDRHRDRPFLLYVAYNAPHYPMNPQSRFLEMYRHLPEPRRSYAALVAGMDDSIGRIVGRLRETGLLDDTFIFFSSDNGAAARSGRGEGGGRNAPFREHKRSLFEGGIRMPAIVSWPRQMPGGQIREQLTVAMDVWPTVAELVGAAPPTDRTIDGRSWLPLLKDPGAAGHEALFFEWDGQQAVRRGRWKLVCNGIVDQDAGRGHRAGAQDAVFLADLVADPAETTNLRARHPEIAQRLLELHASWRRSIEKDPTATKAAD